MTYARSIIFTLRDIMHASTSFNAGEGTMRHLTLTYALNHVRALVGVYGGSGDKDSDLTISPS
jgi:hypothetical protein